MEFEETFLQFYLTEYIHDEGKEIPILLRQVLFTLATRWAQQLVDETESLVKTR